MTTPLEATARDMADKLNAYVGTQSDCYPLLLALMRQATEAIAREKLEAEAQAAAMREALERTWSECECGHIIGGPADYECGTCGATGDSEAAIQHVDDCFQAVLRNALSSTAGAELLAELEDLRAKVAAISDLPDEKTVDENKELRSQLRQRMEELQAVRNAAGELADALDQAMIEAEHTMACHEQRQKAMDAYKAIRI